ncbi:SDR family NAD(P)-dependent oxidoreductase [Streptomyces olivochromogenes]|uniref:Oxidoreductase n=1 Tax=Streptomyces olivochromogenes TaxID=1963 RepID=A0A250VQR8_STROL|nr:SDR family NAD(P)-dependent oxidoreductase [Streptomyces olivochromogenes]GAX56429.1 oxidoreductase [Streptomyces olivochromogenes]
MNIDLSGRITMVTGSTAGIGEAAAAALAASGAEVVVNGRNPESVAATAERLGGRGVTADVGTPEGADAVIEQVPDVDIPVVLPPPRVGGGEPLLRDLGDAVFTSSLRRRG